MRKAILSIVAVLSALAWIIGGLPTTAGAEGAVDLSATTSSSPTSVSPPGSLVFYTATYTNHSPIPVLAILTNTTTNGTLFRQFQSPGCTTVAAGTANPSITCNVTLAPQGTRTIEVIIQTPTTAPATVTNKARADIDPSQVDLVDTDTSNDETSVVTPVNPSSTTGSAAFVEEGKSLGWKKHLMTVREAELGVVAYMNDVPAPSTVMCGTVVCEEGLHIDFDQNPKFFGLVQVDVNFGKDDPCRGSGTSKCSALWFRKSPTSPTQPLMACGSQGPNDPCIESSHKQGNEFHWILVMETNDPDVMQAVKSLTGNQV